MGVLECGDKCIRSPLFNRAERWGGMDMRYWQIIGNFRGTKCLLAGFAIGIVMLGGCMTYKPVLDPRVTGTVLVIPPGVIKIKEHEFEGRRELTRVVIPSSVTWIGDWAFRGCTGLTGVSMSGELKEIGQRAFQGCSGLTHMEFPESLETISWNAFKDCTALNGVRIPKNVSNVYSAFAGCTSLMAIEVESGNPLFSSVDGILLKTGKDVVAFPAGKEGVVWIPDGVSSIRGLAFEGCSKVTEIYLPEGVDMIYGNAFAGCTNLERIHIPETVREIGRSSISDFDNRDQIHTCAFDNCSRLKEFVVAPGNPHYSSVDGVLFDKKGIELLDYPRGRQGAYAIPDGTVCVRWDAFHGCTGLTSLHIPARCVGLVGLLNGGVFSGCDNLQSFTVDPDNPFYSVRDGVLCSQRGRCLQACPPGRRGFFTVPNHVTAIAPYAFKDCRWLTGIYFPDLFKPLEWTSFLGCNSLAALYFDEVLLGFGIPEWDGGRDGKGALPPSVKMVLMGDSKHSPIRTIRARGDWPSRFGGVSVHDVSVAILPEEVQLPPGGKMQFKVVVTDENGVAITPPPPVTWKVMRGGKIDANTGEYTAKDDMNCETVCAKSVGRSASCHVEKIEPKKK